jgi:hypothetical protein
MDALAAAAAVVGCDKETYAPDNVEHREAPVDLNADEAQPPLRSLRWTWTMRTSTPTLPPALPRMLLQR